VRKTKKGLRNILELYGAFATNTLDLRRPRKLGASSRKIIERGGE